MLGILCGLESEARLARLVPGAVVALSAANPSIARKAAKELVAKGCTHLVSYGIAGGLSPDFVAGDALIGTEVMSNHGSWVCDAAWGESLKRLNPTCKFGSVFGADRVVGLSSDKKNIFNKTKACIADMESHVVAEIAAAHNLPFAVVRVVTDTVDMTMPPAALVPLKEDGSANIKGVMISFLLNPVQIFATIRLALNMGKAMRRLALYKVALPS